MRPRYLIFAILLVCTALSSCSSQKSAPSAAFTGGRPAVPVTVAVAARESVPTEVRAVGNVDPFKTVQVKSQIAGELMSVKFQEGSQIRQGDLLFEIDPRPYREALRQAEAAVAKDKALLAQAQANLGRDQAQMRNAETDAKRYDELFKEGIAARNQYEQVRTTFDAQREGVRADQAAIESAQASLDSDRAAVERAKLDLSYCEIHSPVSGRAGNLLVHAGNLVKANDIALVVINQIEPIFVSFAVPEHHLNDVRARMTGGRKLEVEASPSHTASQTVRGTLTVIDNAVDATTGTIKLKALFDNHERLLWPGQFVNVLLRLSTSEQTVVPSEAVQAGQQGQFIYVVKQNNSVEFRPVTVGSAVNGKSIIDKGVAAGETVVTDGQLLLAPGAQIRVVPAAKAEPQKS